MQRIGEFSKLAKTSVKTLRFYDEIGLFKPSFVDENGYRYYEFEQLNALQTIVTLRNMDMPIDEIKRILGGENASEILAAHLKELEEELGRNVRNISLIKNYMAKAEKGEFMSNYEVKEIMLPKCVVYYRHGVIKSMADIVDFILGAGAECAANNPNLKCLTPGYCFVTYEATEYCETDVELEYAEAVEGFGKESENIAFKQLEAQKAISITHIGAYSGLRAAYAYALNYVKEKGYEIDGHIRERYIDGCWNKESEEEYVTEIQIPIK